MKKKIVTDIVYLRQKSKEIKFIETGLMYDYEYIQSIIKDLEDSLDTKKGIGLTAIQIGIPLQVSIIRIPNKEPMNLYNAKIIEKQDPIKFGECCLSIPGLTIMTRRYNNIVWENGDGQRYSSDGIEAICVAHEIDHMNGITILDRKWKKRR